MFYGVLCLKKPQYLKKPNNPLWRCFHYTCHIKNLDKQVWAKSVVPDQTAPEGEVWSGSTLLAILSLIFGPLHYGKATLFKF